MEFTQETSSIWQKTEPRFFPSLSSHESVDVCVLGGGIAGLSAAYRFLTEGKTVALIDRNSLRHGESMLTSAHLATALDHRYCKLRQKHGAEVTSLAAQSHAYAIDEIERLVARESIDCDFERVPGYLFLAPGDDPELLSRELFACQEAGLTGVELLAALRSPFFPTGPCLMFPRQARFHPGRYLAGLCSAIERRGGRIYSHTEALGVSAGSPVRVETNRGFQVVCETLVIATNAPFGGGFLQAKMAPYRSYVVGIALPANRRNASLFWDTAEPYHFLRTVADGGESILLVGGADHRTGQAPASDPYETLINWARDRLGLEGKVRYRWSGQVLEPHDGLAFIGACPGMDAGSFVITGLSGNGLTYATLGARLIADLAAGRATDWARIYDPARIKLRSIATFVSENARSAAPYADWVSGGDVSDFAEIPLGEGAVVRDGMQKLAVFRDERGRPHFFSAVCPHQKGIVRWNSAEKTWDCPCHGSRFDRLGHVLNGPAKTGLRAIEDTITPETDAISA